MTQREKMVELLLNKIRMDESRPEQLLVLKEKRGARYLPVVVGFPECQSIKTFLRGVKSPRPLTHDLMFSIIKKLSGKLEKVVIDKVDNGTFFAKLHFLKKTGETILIDSRPSDAVALALRAAVPVFAADSVLDTAGVEEV